MEGLYQSRNSLLNMLVVEAHSDSVGVNKMGAGFQTYVKTLNLLNCKWLQSLSGFRVEGLDSTALRKSCACNWLM